jgi:RNA polymerase sigma factor (sigma-70 family)
MGDGVREDAAALVRRHRLAAGLSQRQLAESAGMSIGVVRDLEQRRTSRLQARSAESLVRALGLDPCQASALARAARVPAGAGPTNTPGTGRGRQQRAEVRLAILGPLAAWRDGIRAGLGPPAQCAVLGLLALAPNMLVRREVIIDVLWGQASPVTAVNLVHKYVSGLRAALDPGWPQQGADGLVVSARTGYRLQVSAGQLDVLQFEELAGAARSAVRRGDDAGACQGYERALGLWRGEPLADVELLRSHPAVTGLDRRRAEVVGEYARAACRAGAYDLVLGHLRELAAREPLNEAVHAHLMIALAGAGQQAAALAVYAGLRCHLDDQLGVRPGAQLSAAHLQVLRQDLPPPAARQARARPESPPAPALPARTAGTGTHVSPAFARFYQDTLPMTITRGYLLYGDLRQAEHAAQEALLAACRHWDHLVALTAAQQRQHVMRALTSRHAEHRRLQPLHARAMTAVLGDGTGVLSHIEGDAPAREMIQAIQNLPPEQRVLALMHWVEKLPLAQIAQDMGISAGTARGHLARARHTLTTSTTTGAGAGARARDLQPLLGT